MALATCHIAWNALLAGLTFSLVVGAVIVPTFQRCLEFRVRLPRRDDGIRIPPSLTGHIERLLFTLIVAFDISGTAPAMIAWVALKMAANWNSPEAQLEGTGEKPTAREVLNRRFSALLTSAVSLIVVVIGGTIALGKVPLGEPLLWTSVGVITFSIVARYGIARKSRKPSPQSVNSSGHG
jgi:hypothetical protein